MSLAVNVPVIPMSASAALQATSMANDTAATAIRNAHKCIVIPQLRRSLTCNTLLITSLPKLSKTSTFQIGSPSSFRIGAEWGTKPFVDVEPLAIRSFDSGCA